MSATPTSSRRLVAILVADVVGYSRLLAEDEAGTLAALRERRKAVVEPLVKQHAGRVVKFLGDGVLIEFSSAVNAVAFALDLQRRMAEMNEPVAEGRRILLRVGINLGEVVGEGSDIYGDGVNIAARLEALAEPGGICLSGKVHEEVRGKVAAAFEDLGERWLHNIAQPVRVYAVRPSRGAAARQPAGSLPEKPTIAVLPFDNMSGDPEQEYFSNGITEDIITELSRFRSLFVIARNSSFAFKGRAIDLREVGRQLGAPYIVEGSVRKSGQRIRISAQLIDAASGNHLWSERYDRDLADIFAIQDEVTAAIASTVAGQVQIAGIESVRRRTGNLAAYDWYLKGLEHWDRGGAEDTVPMMSCLAKAIALDPNFARAHALLAFAQLVASNTRRYEAEPGTGLDEALRTAERAVALDGNDATGYAALAGIYQDKKRLDLAAFHIGKARALNPNDPNVIGQQCYLEALGPTPERTLELIEHARRLSPVQPNWLCEPWGIALYQLRRYAEAADVFERATAKRPYVMRCLAACHAQLGDLTRARAAAAESLSHEPDFSLNTWLAYEPYASDANLLHMAEGMRKAGLPE